MQLACQYVFAFRFYRTSKILGYVKMTIFGYFNLCLIHLLNVGGMRSGSRYKDMMPEMQQRELRRKQMLRTRNLLTLFDIAKSKTPPVITYIYNPILKKTDMKKW